VQKPDFEVLSHLLSFVEGIWPEKKLPGLRKRRNNANHFTWQVVMLSKYTLVTLPTQSFIFIGFIASDNEVNS
jgi:hypothetical protein